MPKLNQTLTILLSHHETFFVCFFPLFSDSDLLRFLKGTSEVILLIWASDQKRFHVLLILKKDLVMYQLGKLDALTESQEGQAFKHF